MLLLLISFLVINVKSYSLTKLNDMRMVNSNAIPFSIKAKFSENLNSVVKNTFITFSTLIPITTTTRVNSVESNLLECSDSISLLKSNDNKQEVIIIGTAHISEDSAKQVRRIISKIRPNVVLIELDINRFGKIGSTNELQNSNIILPKFTNGAQLNNEPPNKSVALSGVSTFLNTVKSWVSRSAGDILGQSLREFYKSVEKLGFKAGGEFKAAYEEAMKIGSKVLLGDRNVNLTLQELAKAIATTNPLKFEVLAAKLFELEQKAGIEFDPKEDITLNKDVLSKFVENLKQRKLLNEVMTVVKEELPDIYNALIGERDKFMAKAIIEANANKLVAVVGMAHMTGIENYLITNTNLRIIDNKC